MATEEHPRGRTSGFSLNAGRVADALRGALDAAEYNAHHFGLIVLKYTSATFEERRAQAAHWAATELHPGAFVHDHR